MLISKYLNTNPTCVFELLTDLNNDFTVASAFKLDEVNDKIAIAFVSAIGADSKLLLIDHVPLTTDQL